MKTADDKGIPCPKCGCCHHFTIRTAPAPRGRIMRLRECRNCGRRLTTYETAAAADRDLAQLGALTRKQVEKLMARLIEMVGWPL